MTTEDRLAALRFAEGMVTRLRTRIEESAGIASTATDGVSVVFAGGKDGLFRQLQYWERRVQSLKGNGSSTKSIDLSGGL